MKREIREGACTYVDKREKCTGSGTLKGILKWANSCSIAVPSSAVDGCGRVPLTMNRMMWVKYVGSRSTNILLLQVSV